ncbi:MAG TPA: N-6 DNA methylase [Haliscomenobacter sp.]|nr:N-6 DNA methylase [Haliscomenobacter sp.]
MENSIPNKKVNGIYYTPDALAEYLARPLIKGEKLAVFDPAYGQGSLLLAGESISRQQQIVKELTLYGCDIHPVNGLLEHLPAANLKQQDFFDYDREKKFDVILTNPPYIRHQNQVKKSIISYRKNNPELAFLSNSSDLWAYFLVKAVTHLHENGSIGAILPWAFIQADYSKGLRAWLAERFSEIKVLALNNPYFESAEERVVLLWLTGYGKKNQSIISAFAQDFTDEISYSSITLNDWLASRIISVAKKDVNDIFDCLKNEFGFCSFGSCARALIGVVTGANKYFIRDIDYCETNNFSEKQHIPILTNAKEIAGLIADGPAILKRLLVLQQDDEEQIKWFLNEGMEAGFDQRSHSKLRRPWYQINPGEAPDAFFPYRVGKIPYLILNDHNIQSTNSIHRVYFKGLSILEKKWFFVSILSIYGQLSISVNAKTYGRGMLKIEPGALVKTIVLKREDDSVMEVYNLLLQLLASGLKDQAVKLATDFINEKLKIPSTLQHMAESSWYEVSESCKRSNLDL